MTRTLLLIQIFFLQFLVIKGQFNATYGFINVAPGTGVSDPGPYPSQTGINFGAMQAFGVSAQPSASGRFSFSNWPIGASNGDDDLNNFSGSLSGLAYYELKLKIQEGFILDLDQISFTMRRSSTGVRNFCVRWDRDNFSTNLSASTGTNTNIQVLPDQVFFWNWDSLSTANDQRGCVVTGFTPLQDSMLFRFYAWNAETSGGSFSIDNLTFTGRLALVADLKSVRSDSKEVKIEMDLNRMSAWLSTHLRAHWSVFDGLGQLVQQDLDAESCFLNYLDSGIYWLKCEVGDKVVWKQLWVGH
jgi:hypothetical protein